MSAIDPAKMAVYRELLKRKDSLTPEKQAVVVELGKRFAEQAGGDPTGKGVDDEYPRVNRAMTTMWSDLNEAVKPLQSVENAKAAAGGLFEHIKGKFKDPKRLFLPMEAVGMVQPTIERLAKGEIPEAFGGAGALALEAAIPIGAAKVAGRVAPSVFRQVKGMAPTPEGLIQRAGANRMAAETATVPSGVPATKTGVVMAAGKRIAAPVRRAIARVEESAARRLSGDAQRPLVQGAPEVGSDQFTPEVMNRTPPPDAPAIPPVEGPGRGIPRDPNSIAGNPQSPRQFDVSTDTIGDRFTDSRPRPTVDLNTSTPVPTVLTAPELNKWMNVRENQLLYGKNPGERILSENLLGPDKATTLQNVTTARKSVGTSMDEVFKRAEAEGVKFELESDIQSAIADAKKTIGKSTDETFMKAIEGIESEIVSRTDDLKNMTPSAAHELEVELGRGVKWTGASTDVQRLLKDIRGRISKKLKTIEGIIPLKERWGDLFEGEQALKSSIRKDAIGRGTGSVYDQVRAKFGQK